MNSFFFKLLLLILGIFIIRFAILQMKSLKKSGIKTKNNFFDKVFFLLFFVVIIGLLIYSFEFNKLIFD